MLYSEIQFPLYLLCYDLSHFSAIARISCWRSSNVIHTCLPSQRLGNFTRSSVIAMKWLHLLHWTFDAQFTGCGHMRWIVSGSLDQRLHNGGVKWSLLISVHADTYNMSRHTHTGIAKEMSRFEDTFWHPLTYSLLLLFSVTEFCCDEFYAISRNSPVREWDIFRDLGKSSPTNIATQETESVWKH